MNELAPIVSRVYAVQMLVSKNNGKLVCYSTIHPGASGRS